MKAEHASPFATAERPQGLRGCGTERELHARGQRAVRHPGSGEPAGQGAGISAWRQAFQSRAPATGADRGWSRISCSGSRCTGSDCGGYRASCAAPDLRGLDGQRITGASDLLKFPLLRLDDWKTWSRWFDAAGVTDPVAQGQVLNRASMLIDAAVDGQGVALARTALAAWDLINGRLVRPIDVSLRMSKTYWIVCPKATSSLPKITLFREWLLAEAADDMRRLKTLHS